LLAGIVPGSQPWRGGVDGSACAPSPFSTETMTGPKAALDAEQKKNYVPHMSTSPAGAHGRPFGFQNASACATLQRAGRMIRIVIEEAMALVSVALFVAMIAAWAAVLSSGW
jgi:hypothetical protein